MNYFILITAYILDFIYKFCKDYGIALVIFTILTRIILFPLLFKITKDSKKRKLLQNEMNEIKYKYIHDKKKMDEELKQLKQMEGIPLTGPYLIILIQIPLFFVLYEVLNKTPIGKNTSVLTPWIPSLMSKDIYFILPIIMTLSRLIPQITGFVKSKQEITIMFIVSLLISTAFSLFLIRSISSGTAIYCITVSLCTTLENYIIRKYYQRTIKIHNL